MHAVSLSMSPELILDATTRILSFYDTIIGSSASHSFWGRLAVEHLARLPRKYHNVSGDMRAFALASLNVWTNCDDNAVVQPIERVLCDLLSADVPSSLSCILHSVIVKSVSVEVVDLCFAKLSSSSSRDANFLTALVKTDLALYGTRLLELIASNSNATVLLDSGALDESIYELMNQSFAHSHGQSLFMIEASIARRLVVCLGDMASRKLDELDSLVSVLSVCVATDMQSQEHYESIGNALIRALVEGLSCPDLIDTADALRRWSRMFQAALQIHAQLRVQLSSPGSHVAQAIVSHATKRLRNVLVNSHTKSFVADFSTILNGWTKLLQMYRSEEWLHKQSAGLIDVFATAISFCVSDAPADDAMGLLLNAANLAGELDCVYTSDHFADATSQSTLRRVFRTVSRHTLFRDALSIECEGRAKLGVLRILHFCVSSLDSVQSNEAVIAWLLPAFDAGVSESDGYMRSIIFRCMTLTQTVSTLACMGQVWRL